MTVTDSRTPPPAPEIPIANFTTTNSVLLPHPLPTVFPVLTSGSNLETVARLSDLCTAFTTGETRSISISPGLLSTARGTSSLPASAAAAQSGLERTTFVLEEKMPFMKGLFKNKVTVRGSQTADWEGRCCLYESVAEKQGVFIWKLRTFEEVEGGKTRVTELIEGSCQGWMRYFVEKECKRANLAQMEKYHTLFN
ncbi:hypothetical protein DFP73DRAFT_564947 [Morchella snyderi]|nr:hypothetical protein DFP73DRAFT_564947 [Morchella snyderi]